MTDYNDGKWHGWNGGECPVHPKTVVEYAMVNSTDKEPARLLRWEHKGRTSDIIAFRVIKEHKDPRDFWVVMASSGHLIEACDDRQRASKLALGARGRTVIHVREVLE